MTPQPADRVAPPPNACRHGELSLALQGGGAFGAFTWGVLDRLLEDGRVAFGALSGASAGAVNGVLLAEGLRTGGRERARALLGRFWTGLSQEAGTSFLVRNGRTGLAFDVSSRMLSPYQLNPFNLNPLRARLEALVDFAALRAASPLPLLIATTHVADGATRIFSAEELTLDVVMASSCLPLIHQAVEIDGAAYWDGGYGANPPLLPLVERPETSRILLVRIVPTSGDDHPTTSPTIVRRLSQISFNAGLQHDLDAVAAMRRLCAREPEPTPEARRILALAIDQLAAEDWVPDLAARSAADLDRSFLSRLRDGGRRAVDTLLAS